MVAASGSPVTRGPLTLERASALRERLVARDERALEELIVLATPWLLGVAQRMLSDPDEAEDVVLDAYRILWDRVGTLSDDQPGLMAWLLRIVRNRAIDRLRARRRHGLRIERAQRSGVLGDEFQEAVTPNEAASPAGRCTSRSTPRCATSPRTSGRRSSWRISPG